MTSPYFRVTRTPAFFGGAHWRATAIIVRNNTDEPGAAPRRQGGDPRRRSVTCRSASESYGTLEDTGNFDEPTQRHMAKIAAGA
jgi:hypothetical protein